MLAWTILRARLFPTSESLSGFLPEAKRANNDSAWQELAVAVEYNALEDPLAT